MPGKPTIGFVGLGRMGSRIVQRLAGQGHEMRGWDRDPAALERAVEAGLAGAATPREVAEGADVIMTCVTEDHGVRAVFGGPDGFLEADVRGKLFIEMTTLRPQTGRDLEQLVEARGASFVDAPVLGTLGLIPTGQLEALVGGSEPNVERARTILDVLARRVVHMGPTGSGYAMKLVANMGLATYVQMLGETIALGAAEGLSIDAMLDVLSTSVTSNGWIKTRMPVIRGEADDVTLDIRTMRKDVMSAVATGAESGVPMPTISGALAAFSAAVAGGWGDGDIGQMTRFTREAMVQRL